MYKWIATTRRKLWVVFFIKKYLSTSILKYQSFYCLPSK